MDSVDNVVNVSGAYLNGVLSARFSRKRDTMDSNDALLTDGQQPYVILAWGGIVNQDGSLQYHGYGNSHVTSSGVAFTSCRK